jgi:hypothetical protein
MITVPAALKTEIEKLRGRYLQARVRIDYSDANIDNTIVAWAGTTQDHTYLEQVYNGKEDVTAPWISLDGSWILGTSALAPETEAEKAKYEIGWWGQELSLPDATFSARTSRLYGQGVYGQDVYGSTLHVPQVSVNFLPRTIQNIRISFDNARMEYAVDFDVVLYDEDGAILYTESVTGNSGLKYVKDITAQNEVVQLTLFIHKWSHAGRQAKVAEMFTSISDMYLGSDIFSINVTENRELPEDGIPLGQTASGQCVVKLFNRDRLFDHDNTASKLYGVIREGNRITPEIGDGTNWVSLGVYYAKAWDIDTSALDVTVTGLDNMARLGESEYKTNQIIDAPAPTTYTTDTAAEWNGGTLTGVVTSGNSLRMVL